ncbi:hypothetical protein Tco_1192598 [Tanacetum coccineum]
MIVDIEDDVMDPVMQCTTLPSHSGFSQKKLVSFVTEIHTLSIDISPVQDCNIEYRMADCSPAFRLPNPKCPIESRAKRDQIINLIRTQCSKYTCLDDGVAASFQRSRIHKPHAHTQAFKVNHSTSR